MTMKPITSDRERRVIGLHEATLALTTGSYDDELLNWAAST
jgi:hypothetical protein